MNNRRTLAAAILLTCGSGLLLPGAAAAQDPEVLELELICSGERLTFSLPPLELFDDDDDWLIGRDEAADCEALATMFSRLDLDASDTLTLAEYDGFPDLWRRRMITLRDEPDPDD